MKLLNPKIRQKFAESLKAVLPVVGIVIVLSFTIAPITSSILLCFLVGAVMVMAGMMFFTLGAEMSMTPMGEKVGARMTQSKNILLIVVLSFLLGVVITISEPDLQVLATQVPSVPNMTLILAVAVGVGIFLVIALLRMLIGVALPPLLTFFYIAVFVLAFLVPENFRAVAFDSGGVTTGPMTVPFIMALGVGIASIRNDHHAADDSFGLVALCSIGPILAVMVLGLIYKPTNADYQPVAIPEIADSVELAQLFAHGIPDYMKEIALSLLPIVLFFGLFQIFALRLSGKTLAKILIGLVYTYIGLVLFLTGANVGFMPAGNYLGQVMAARSYRWVLVPVGALIGYFIVASGLCIESSGRGADGRRYLCQIHGHFSVRGRILIRSTGDDPRADGDPDSMVFDPGLRCGDRTILFCTEDIHSDRLRLRRCGKRSHDSYLFTAVSAGCLCGGGRQFSRRCFRCGSNGSHDTADHDSDIGNGISVKAAEERCRRICRCGGCIWCFG